MFKYVYEYYKTPVKLSKCKKKKIHRKKQSKQGLPLTVVKASKNVGILHGEKGALLPKYYFRWFAVVRNPRLQTLLVHYVHEKVGRDKDILTREAEFKTNQ